VLRRLLRQGDLGVALLAGDEERRGATVHSLVHLRAGGDQRRGDLGMALLTGDEERRGAAPISPGLVGVGAAGQQGGYLVGAAVPNGVDERCVVRKHRVFHLLAARRTLLFMSFSSFSRLLPACFHTARL